MQVNEIKWTVHLNLDYTSIKMCPEYRIQKCKFEPYNIMSNKFNLMSTHIINHMCRHFEWFMVVCVKDNWRMYKMILWFENGMVGLYNLMCLIHGFMGVT